MASNTRFMGAPYPLCPDPKGYFHSETDIETLKADMLILLLTNLGERVMLPEYGTDLRSLIFDPNDVTLAEKARDMIIESIRRWEPRISVDAVEVLTVPDKTSLNKQDDHSELQGILFIRIIFKDPKNIQEVQELSLQVPLSAG